MRQRDGFRIGVDTGGTFTDLVLTASGQPIRTHKLLSTPDDPARAVIEGIAAILRAHATDVAHVAHAADAAVGAGNDHGSADAPGDIPAHRPHVIHGSTVATNAMLEGRTGRAAFITTAGFEDTLHLARQDRPHLYDLCIERPAPPLPRQQCIGVVERMRCDGQVIEPPAGDAIAALIEQLRSMRVEAVAISLLHSYANPAHERMLAFALREALPDVHLTVSHELLPEFREYERGATCVVNALVAPRMVRYLARLSDALGEDRLRIMASEGGSLPPSWTAHQPVRTVLSGPAGGVLGAWSLCRDAGYERIISFDMGGTSTDVSLCDGGLTRTTEGHIGALPLRLPMVDIHTVGAGGGSIGWIDVGGALRVGPKSAGAEPGPACYGRQHPPKLATVTDAHAVLGHLPADRPLGGDLRLDVDAARHAMAILAQLLGMSIEHTARGMLRVVEANMARAISRISLERGHDPRGFVLVPFGGAGALHACRLAEHLDIPRVLVPQHPGLLSAIGMLHAAPLYTFSHAVMHTLEYEAGCYPPILDVSAVREAVVAVTDRADQAMRAEGIDAAQRTDESTVDLRYEGQSYELTVPLMDDPIRTFEVRHKQLYGYASPGRAIEIVTVRLMTRGPVVPPVLAGATRRECTQPVPRPDPDGRWLHLDRHELCEGDTHEASDVGLIICEFSATTLVQPGWRVTVNPQGQLLLERQRKAQP